MANTSKEKTKVNKVLYSTGGNGYKYARISLPISWLEQLDIGEYAELEIKRNSIVIRKVE